jgi:putative FmdB family regulatory protein
MPIYAYRCEACGHEFDALQKLSEAPLTDCPACGASALKKQITAAAFRLKGAGWYETDFKQDGKKNLHETGDKDKDKDKDKDQPKAADGEKKTDVKADKGAEKPATTKTETAAPKAKPEAKPKPSGAAT